jgi:(p)ppGpp synthase/HD superfamily hydrolase
MKTSSILKVIRFADKKHKGQTRKVSGDEYITHPIAVSYILANFKKSKYLENLICAAILHDVIEDTDAEYKEIFNLFDDQKDATMVIGLVSELTSNQKEIDKLGKTEYLKRKMKGISSYALTLKLCDRLSNMSDSPSEKQKEDTKEILSFVESNRKLSATQKALVAEIRQLL